MQDVLQEPLNADIPIAFFELIGEIVDLPGSSIQCFVQKFLCAGGVQLGISMKAWYVAGASSLAFVINGYIFDVSHFISSHRHCAITFSKPFRDSNPDKRPINQCLAKLINYAHSDEVFLHVTTTEVSLIPGNIVMSSCYLSTLRMSFK